MGLMSKPARQPSVVPTIRPGEGTIALDIKINTVSGVDGKSINFMGVDLSKAPVPDRKFTADTCSVVVSDYVLKLIFGQERIDGKGLRSAIVVQMTRNGGANFVRFCDGLANPSLDEVAKSERIPSEKPSPPAEEPPQALTLSANMPFPAVSGHEACVDFYEASPFSMGVAARAHKLSLEPVVRIDMRTPLLLGLVHELRTQLAEELKFKIEVTAP